MRLTGLMLIGLAACTCTADLIDDFEDGDYTRNPTWTVVNVAGGAAVLVRLPHRRRARRSAACFTIMC